MFSITQTSWKGESHLMRMHHWNAKNAGAGHAKLCFHSRGVLRVLWMKTVALKLFLPSYFFHRNRIKRI